MSSAPTVCYRHPTEETRLSCTRCERPICPECMHPAPVGHHCPECIAEGRTRVRRRLPRPRSLTMVLLVALGVVFVAEVALGGLRSLGVLIDMGAMERSLVLAGQYWRLVTATFLHAGPLHLLLNGYALFLFGTLIESEIGPWRLGGLYLVTGFVASAVSFAFGSAGRVSVGASGAIFGLLGAWLVSNWRRRRLAAAQANLRFALLLIGLNVVLGFSVGGIDNLAHLGGLGAGILAGFAGQGFGRRGVRVASRIAGLAFVASVGVALVAWRVA